MVATLKAGRFTSISDMANDEITWVRPEASAAWRKCRDFCKGAEAVKHAEYA
jgi:hypothetical protein